MTLAAAVGVLMVLADAGAETLTATQVNQKTIRVVVPGRFETDFTLRKGFGHTWFDLKHDPKKAHDLAPVANENGFFWVKNAPGPTRPGGGSSWYCNPSKDMTLLEASPVRARIRLRGVHMRYGQPGRAREWPELGFELTWTIYPTGHVYGDYALINEKPVTFHHFLAIVKSTGHWGPSGKGVGKNEIHPATEAGDNVKPTGRKPSAWVLQHADGPTHFTDILMVLQDTRGTGAYWHMGYKDRDYRTGLNIMRTFPNGTSPAGGMHIPVMFRIADDMNGAATAALYANAYRTPGKLTVTKGTAVTDDPGDFDGDGYNEAEGCYVLKAAPDGVAFTLYGAEVPRMTPTFKIKAWKGGVPEGIAFDAQYLAPGRHFNASVKDDVLLLQLLEDVKKDAPVALTQ